MKRYLSILGFIVVCITLAAQGHHQHHRTPEDIARRQTDILVEELEITDSVMVDTLYRMHYKYAQMRHDSCYNREYALQCMLKAQEELSKILSPEQFELFKIRCLSQSRRSPKYPCNRIAPINGDALPPQEQTEHNIPTKQP